MWEKNKNKNNKSTTKSSGSKSKTYSSGVKNKKYNTGANKKKNDPYDVYDYKSAQDFADDKYEEFYDYEDDYDVFIIIGWTVLELCFVNAMYRCGITGKEAVVGLFAGIIVVALLSIICYLLYYKLEYFKGYYDGMIPLVLVGIMVAIIDVIGWRSL